MADWKKRALLPPHPVQGTQTGGSLAPVREINNPAYIEVDGSQQGKRMSIPLPDYETLFPQKRHGVQGQTRWDHIIAEVTQRKRDTEPEHLGPEMSVDGPVEHRHSLRSSLPQESPAAKHHQTQPQEPKPVSSKKAPAPAPPKYVSALHSQPVANSSQSPSPNIARQPLMKPNPSPVPGPINTDIPSRESLSTRSRDGARKALQPPAQPRPSSPMERDTAPTDDQRKTPVHVNKEVPTAKPRQRVSGKEPVQQDSAVTPVTSLNSNVHTSSPNMSSVDRKGRQIKDNFVEFDPFPTSELLPKDPWAQVKQKEAVKFEDLGMTPDDLDNIFGQERTIDPFASFNGSISNKHSEHKDKDDISKQASPTFQRRNSQKRNQSLPSATHSDNKPRHEEETTIPKSDQGFSAWGVTNESVTPKLEADVKTQSRLYGERKDPFGAEPFTATSSLSSEPLQVVLEEPEPQAGALSGGKTPLRAWVSPSEVQPVSAQNSSGGGLALTARRPHPVKPMSSVENQHPISTPAVKEMKVRDSTPGKFQVPDSVGSGPYTQLTQEELITLVVKQQTDLSRKDAKIVELEEYIDNLLVRVIEEKPTILHSLNSKPV